MDIMGRRRSPHLFSQNPQNPHYQQVNTRLIKAIQHRIRAHISNNQAKNNELNKTA